MSSSSSHFGPFRVDRRTGELWRGKRRVPIQQKTFAVLEALLDGGGDVVTREELRARLWPADTHVEFSANLNVAVAKLRRALGDAARTPRFVETVGRRGYRLIVPVDRAARPQDGTPGAGPSRRPAVASIAVLPFESLSADPRQAFFADGMTDALVTALAKVRALRVTSRQSVRRFRGSAKSASQIASELGVDALIDGTVQRSATRVRITAQLVCGRTDDHLWSEAFERELIDSIPLQSEIARAIAREVRVVVTPSDEARLGGATRVLPEALDEYLRGRQLWGRGDREDLPRALEHLEHAAMLEPGFARVHAAIADCYGSLAFFEVLPPERAAAPMRAAAERAIALDPESAEGLAARAVCALFCDWDFARAERDLARAIEADPGYTFAHVLRCLLFGITRRFEAGLASGRRALELDPLNVHILAKLGLALAHTGHAGEGLALLRRALELEPGHHVVTHDLAEVLLFAGRPAEAVAEHAKLGDFSPGFGHALACAGRTADARRVLNRLSHAPPTHYVSPVEMALTHLGLGEDQDALSWLERGREMRALRMIQINLDPRFAPLRGHSRFQDLLASVRLVELPR
jgi:TolB-like protein